MLSEKISFQNKRILVCPLDWGLGHAARCIPLIKYLQEQNNKVIIACNEKQKTFLRNEIEGVEFVDLFGYEVNYSNLFPLGIKILFQFPKLCLVVRKENVWLTDFLKSVKIDVVISDNRFGLYNKNIESVFITHQVFVKAPFLSGIANYINHLFIKKFNQCWVPDFEEKEKSLSGELSQGKVVNKNTVFIGPLSRFTKKESAAVKFFDVLLLLSGVEPQRSLLEKKLVAVFTNTKVKIALVRGTNIKQSKSFPENFTVTNVATTQQLETLFYSSEKIICRSGYSTLMDLYALGLNALLVPTPGQTEQEYLAEYWNKKFGFKTLSQNEISEASVLNLLNPIKNPVIPIENIN